MREFECGGTQNGGFLGGFLGGAHENTVSMSLFAALSKFRFGQYIGQYVGFNRHQLHDRTVAGQKSY